MDGGGGHGEREEFKADRRRSALKNLQCNYSLSSRFQAKAVRQQASAHTKILDKTLRRLLFDRLGKNFRRVMISDQEQMCV